MKQRKQQQQQKQTKPNVISLPLNLLNMVHFFFFFHFDSLFLPPPVVASFTSSSYSWMIIHCHSIHKHTAHNSGKTIKLQFFFSSSSSWSWTWTWTSNIKLFCTPLILFACYSFFFFLPIGIPIYIL